MMNARRQVFVERFNKVMKDNKLSQRKLASLLGVQHISVHQWSNGIAYPMEKSISNIAKALDVDYDWLVGLDVTNDIDDWIYEVINASQEKKNAMKKIWKSIKEL